MKIIKGILNSILAVLMLLCVTVLVFAFNPKLTSTVAAKLSGSEISGNGGEAADGQTGPRDEGTDGQPGTDSQAGAEDLPEPVIQTGADSSYIPVSEEEVTSPEAVRNRNGYEPVRESKEQVGDEDAEKLQAGLDTGETGDGLTFDPMFYPYYDMLEEDMKALYRQIYANAMAQNVSFSPVAEVTVEEVKYVFEAVYNDHPELFWLETGYTCKYLRSGKCIELTLVYNESASHLDRAKAEFEAAAEEILSGAAGLAGDLEKEKYVHDALVDKVDYDERASMNQSAYSALVNGTSVCAGYARAFQYLMMELGVPCYYCTGYSGEDHAWNIIQTGGRHYNVDVTWDDTEPSTYDYYNKTDAEYAGTHVRKGLSVYLPACAGTKGRDNNAQNGSAQADTAQNGGQESATSPEDPGENPVTADNPVNQNPLEPLRLDSQDTDTSDSQSYGQSGKDALERAGLSEEDVLKNLEEYYADCQKQMTEAGTGLQEFRNVIPESMWSSIERIYSNESYRKGYVDEALKNLGVENFAIQLQAERLGGGYLRLYHNISTW